MGTPALHAPDVHYEKGLPTPYWLCWQRRDAQRKAQAQGTAGACGRHDPIAGPASVRRKLGPRNLPLDRRHTIPCHLRISRRSPDEVGVAASKTRGRAWFGSAGVSGSSDREHEVLKPPLCRRRCRRLQHLNLLLPETMSQASLR